MQIDPVLNVPRNTAPGATPSAQDAATDAFGLSFESLLRIILTQLTFQDPLKPMDNFEFVSQLAQFSQLQIGQTANDRLQLLVLAQGNSQAAGLLGRQVDIPAGAATLSGKVVAISFANGEPRLTIESGDGQTISGISIASITQIRETAGSASFAPPASGLPAGSVLPAGPAVPAGSATPVTPNP